MRIGVVGVVMVNVSVGGVGVVMVSVSVCGVGEVEAIDGDGV